MEDKLRLNIKLIGFEGIIGRYDFFYNKALIAFISSIIYTPFLIWFLYNLDSISENICLGKLLLNNPFVLSFTLLATLFIVFLDISNSIRRINDILAKVHKQILLIASLFIIISSLCFLFIPYEVCQNIVFIKVLFDIFLICKPGKITSNYPHDFTKQFNWGALFGTWIWGLLNKTYITLLQLVFMFTPMGIPFALICGIKGNEWAYKSKKYDDVDKFNAVQKKQANIFIIFFVILFIFSEILFYVSLIVLSTNDVEGVENKMYAFFERTYIDSYEIEENENKFYVEGKYWKDLEFKQRYNVLKMCARLAANKRKAAYEEENPGSYKYYSWTSELSRTKIYSTEKHELLAEFEEQIDFSKEEITFKDILKEVDAFKFYEPTK